MSNEKVNIKLHDIPGSVFVEKRSNTLVVQVKNKRKYTGLKDTETNRKYAERIKENMYLELIGLRATTVIQRKNLQQLFDLYISEREITKAPKTLRMDKIAYKNIFKKSIYSVPELIESEVKIFLKKSVIADESKNIYMRTIQTFFNWLHENGHIPERINLKKKYFLKTVKIKNKIFTIDEINKLIQYFNKIDKEFSVLIQLLSLTGLRIGEALDLTYSQVFPNRIELHNKNDRTSEQLIITNVVYDLIQSIRQKGIDKVFRWKYSSCSRLNRRFNTALENIGIEKDGRSFHEIRKSFLFYLQKSGVQVELAQKLMRHKNIRVTIEFYQSIENTDLENAMNKLATTMQQ